MRNSDSALGIWRTATPTLYWYHQYAPTSTIEQRTPEKRNETRKSTDARGRANGRIVRTRTTVYRKFLEHNLAMRSRNKRVWYNNNNINNNHNNKYDYSENNPSSSSSSISGGLRSRGLETNNTDHHDNDFRHNQHENNDCVTQSDISLAPTTTTTSSSTEIGASHLQHPQPYQQQHPQQQYRHTPHDSYGSTSARIKRRTKVAWRGRTPHTMLSRIMCSPPSLQVRWRTTRRRVIIIIILVMMTTVSLVLYRSITLIGIYLLESLGTSPTIPIHHSLEKNSSTRTMLLMRRPAITRRTEPTGIEDGTPFSGHTSVGGGGRHVSQNQNQIPKLKKRRQDSRIQMKIKKNETKSKSHHRPVIQLDSFNYLLRGGQFNLCQKILKVTGAKRIGEETKSRYDNNLRYHLLNSSVPPLLNMTINCHDPMNGNAGFGVGLFIKGFYSVRIAATLGLVDFAFHCQNPNVDYGMDVVSHFQGYYPAPPSLAPWPLDGTPNDTRSVCGMQMLPSLFVMSHEIQRQMRRLAVTVVGSRGHDMTDLFPNGIPDRPAAVFPDVELDDVAIHFRCGDILSNNLPNFGIIKFEEYLKYISPHTPSIGIVTQPFDADRNRIIDRDQVDDCKIVVQHLVQFLQTAYPNARINIRNDVNETLPLALARLTMANQSFVSLSSFGIFPVISSLGQGYFQRGNDMVNPFATAMQQYLHNIHMMDSPILSSADCASKPLADILHWLETPSR